jgi:hypothetical protein
MEGNSTSKNEFSNGIACVMTLLNIMHPYQCENYCTKPLIFYVAIPTTDGDINVDGFVTPSHLGVTRGDHSS